MSNIVGAHWRSCLTVTVLCRSTWMTWRRRTSASSSVSTSWRRGYSRSMRRAAKTCTARWVAKASWGRLFGGQRLVWLTLSVCVAPVSFHHSHVCVRPPCVYWPSCPEMMGQVACLFYQVTVVFLGGLNINGGDLLRICVSCAYFSGL